jgi:perosamine synthetase
LPLCSGDYQVIPVNEPLLDGKEKEKLIECIDTGWISSGGPFVEEFEKQFGKFLGLSPGVAVCNGTAALETALYALEIGPGDEVIMPSFTIISCAVAALRLGAMPILVDIEPETWTMDISLVEEKITARTKAIMAVHIYGHPVEMDRLLQIGQKYGVSILEDAAEVHGAEYYSEYLGGRWLRCGSIGDIASFSFYGNKIVTTGEGGMIVSSDPKLLSRARSYRNLCFESGKRFYHTDLGYNFRMTNLQAAVGVAQMERIEEFIEIKRQLGDHYRNRINDIPGLRFQIEKSWAKSVYWMYSVELDPALGLDAETVMKRLSEHKVATRPFFLGLHRQPALREKGLVLTDRYPNTDRASKYGFYLPSGMTLTEDKIQVVCDNLRKALQ